MPAATRTTSRRLRPLLLVVLLVVGCGGGGRKDAETPPARAVPWLNPDGQFPVVGSLSVNPKDDALFMATNKGLFRLPEGASKPKRITGRLTTPDGSGLVSAELVVRFVGPDEMLASGHPAPNDLELPPALGLIRSTDAGRTWTSVSELGAADFHAVERSQDVIVGSRYGEAAILVSRDGGRTWRTRASPSVLVDIESNPGNSDEWIASAASGVYRTRDEGRTWRLIDPIPNSYFAWPDAKTLYRLDPGGELMVSADGGDSWDARGKPGGEPQAIVADGVDVLYTLLLDGTVKQSTDGGRTWTTRVSPERVGT